MKDIEWRRWRREGGLNGGGEMMRWSYVERQKRVRVYLGLIGVIQG